MFYLPTSMNIHILLLLLPITTLIIPASVEGYIYSPPGSSGSSSGTSTFFTHQGHYQHSLSRQHQHQRSIIKSTVLNAHRRRNHHYRSSSARNNANSTEFETTPSSSSFSSSSSSYSNTFISSSSDSLSVSAGTGTATIQLPSFQQDFIQKKNDLKGIVLNADQNAIDFMDSAMSMSKNKTFFIPFTKNNASVLKSSKDDNNTNSNNTNTGTSSNTDTLIETDTGREMETNTTIITSPINNNNNKNNKNANRADFICRIVASADYKIPSLQKREHLQNTFLKEIDAISKAQTYQNTQNQVYYMEEIQKSHEAIQRERYDARTKTKIKKKKVISTVPKKEDDIYDQEEEKKVVSTLRQSLEDSGFQLLNQRDVELCDALNAGYLLRLSILPDVSELDPSIGKELYPELYGDSSGIATDGSSSSGATNENDSDSYDNDSVNSSNDGKIDGKEINNENVNNGLLYDGRILVYRRGYSEEVTNGRLLLPKFDYLQSSLVQRIASNFANKIGDTERKITDKAVEIGDEILSKIVKEIPQRIQRTYKKMTNLNSSSGSGEDDEENNNNVSTVKSKLSIVKKKMQPPALGRYQQYNRFGVSPDNNDALSPFLVCEIADVKTDEDEMEVDNDLYEVLKSGSLACKHDLDEGKPNSNYENNIEQVQLLKRVSIANLVDFFSVGGRRRLIKSLFEDSELVEPTYEEVILIWRPLPDKTKTKRDIKLPNYVYDVAEIFEVEDRLPDKSKSEPNPLPIEIRAFDRVPMANLLAVFPKTKLIFRPADAFIFDLVNITTFLAVLSSVKFDSPKLDLIALVSGVLWVLRTFFRYSNKLARYDLLVNKFLTSRISHRNSGAFRYVVAEASTQRGRRASLVHEWLVQYVGEQPIGTVLTRDHILRNGIFGINKNVRSKQPIQLDLNAALVDLVDLDLISFSNDESEILLEVKDGMKAKESLKKTWNDIIFEK